MRPKKCPEGVPLWMVSYGDMMALLLVFFIMLYAISSPQKTKTQTIVESLSNQFGYARTQVAAPGQKPPQNSNRSQIRSTGRARRNDTLRGGNPVLSPQGDYTKVRSVRPNKEDIEGGIVYFNIGADELSDQGRATVKTIANQLRGSPYKAEIKGHTSTREPGIYANNLYYLGFSRAMKVRDELIRQGVKGDLLQVTSVGPDEPTPESLVTSGLTPQQANAFVEVIRLLESN